MQKFDEFLNDVQEDMRQAKIEKYWKRYGKQAVFACTLVLGAAVAHTLYKNHQNKLILETSDKFIAAQNFIASNNLKDALTIFNDLSNSGAGFYKTLSLFSQAGTLFKQETADATEEAMLILKKIENDTSIEKNYRELAEILRFGHEINTLKGTDKMLDAIRLRLDTLIKEKGAWYYLALELKGVILYKIAAYSESVETFLSLAQDKDTPNALKLRAQLMTQVLASKLNILKK
ncbi:MAG TPA: hypothetical protein DIC42_03610 [Holosporales bacterium]|nr:hypothetical protein [Holosporales bacterium]